MKGRPIEIAKTETKQTKTTEQTTYELQKQN